MASLATSGSVAVDEHTPTVESQKDRTAADKGGTRRGGRATEGRCPVGDTPAIRAWRWPLQGRPLQKSLRGGGSPT